MKSLLITLAILNACGLTFCYFFTPKGQSGEDEMTRGIGWLITLVACVVVDILAVMIFAIVRHFAH